MKEIKRVLILGNSLVRHEPLEAVGWANNWGMAASCEEKDFVHVLKGYIQEEFPEAEVFSFNIAEFSRSYHEREYDAVQNVNEFAYQWKPDLIIMKIGENADDEKSVAWGFEQYYEGLIEQLRVHGNATVLCADCFWEKKYINDTIRRVAERNGYLFADMVSLGRDPSNKALGQFEHPGVCDHPSDKGMEEIAKAMWKVIQEN